MKANKDHAKSILKIINTEETVPNALMLNVKKSTASQVCIYEEKIKLSAESWKICVGRAVDEFEKTTSDKVTLETKSYIRGYLARALAKELSNPQVARQYANSDYVTV